MILSSDTESKLATIVCFATGSGKTFHFFGNSVAPIIFKIWQRMVSDVRLHEHVKFFGNFYEAYYLTDQLGIGNLHHRELLKCVNLASKVSDRGATVCPGVWSAYFVLNYDSGKNNFVKKGACNFQLALFIFKLIASLSFYLSTVLKICNQVRADDRGDRAKSLHPRGPLRFVQIEIHSRRCYCSSPCNSEQRVSNDARLPVVEINCHMEIIS